MSAIVVFNPFHQSIKSPLLGMKCVLKQKDLQMFELKLNKYHFCPLEVVGRGSETQIQVGENINEIPWRVKCHAPYRVCARNSI